MNYNNTIYYLRRDHQGSITGLVNGSGVLVEEYSFDAWGSRRSPSNWANYTVSTPTYLYRGYTFHEHLDQFDLINMNGRAYDPVVGRFLSVDPVIQNGANTQNYNRYSYCLNNPLKYTDPSGYMSRGWQNLANRITDLNRELRMSFNNWYHSNLQITKELFKKYLAGLNSEEGAAGGGGGAGESFAANVAKWFSNYSAEYGPASDGADGDPPTGVSVTVKFTKKLMSSSSDLFSISLYKVVMTTVGSKPSVIDQLTVDGKDRSIEVKTGEIGVSIKVKESGEIAIKTNFFGTMTETNTNYQKLGAYYEMGDSKRTKCGYEIEIRPNYDKIGEAFSQNSQYIVPVILVALLASSLLIAW